MPPKRPKRSGFYLYITALPKDQQFTLCSNINKYYSRLAHLLHGNYYPTTSGHEFKYGESEEKVRRIKILGGFVDCDEYMYRNHNLKYYDVIVTLCNFFNEVDLGITKVDQKRLEKLLPMMSLIKYTKMSISRARELAIALSKMDEGESIENVMFTTKCLPTEMLVAMTLCRCYIISIKSAERFDTEWGGSNFKRSTGPTEQQNGIYFETIQRLQQEERKARRYYKELKEFFDEEPEISNEIRNLNRENKKSAEIQCGVLKSDVERLVDMGMKVKEDHKGMAVEFMKQEERFDVDKVEELIHLCTINPKAPSASTHTIPTTQYVDRQCRWRFGKGPTRRIEKVPNVEVTELFDSYFMQKFNTVEFARESSAGSDETVPASEPQPKKRAPARVYNKKDKLAAFVNMDEPSTSRASARPRPTKTSKVPVSFGEDVPAPFEDDNVSQSSEDLNVPGPSKTSNVPGRSGKANVQRSSETGNVPRRSNKRSLQQPLEDHNVPGLSRSLNVPRPGNANVPGPSKSLNVPQSPKKDNVPRSRRNDKRRSKNRRAPGPSETETVSWSSGNIGSDQPSTSTFTSEFICKQELEIDFDLPTKASNMPPLNIKQETPSTVEESENQEQRNNMVNIKVEAEATNESTRSWSGYFALKKEFQ
ncbi:unnamed protein product [Bursaphelenchus okinawaensis]|uniref:Uncharacterized protein n=1 Tax=Bursaphelenchus okinawaensis TaxID=465554 RepID=A0A811JWK1_9BILA|nr:unnamed protein product [Bursaphelenchus okinawaensis]CAG9085868.1 unnamed protein product [Bursaphelenchus okinawaensis]